MAASGTVRVLGLLARGPGLRQQLRPRTPHRGLGSSGRADSQAPAAAALEHAGVGHGDAPRAEDNLYRKNPDYHGFSADPMVDVWNMRLAFFFGVSVAIVMGSVFVHYLPDHGMRRWARREAELRIKALEARGDPLISDSYFPPSSIVLPPGDEE
uniref:NADH dehydrogenase [ubiquinone] 1 beta subcomplex subunit 11, mitochondrial n=1 Tax=Callorhinchus milii TaxID=7868 RepID=V9LHQ2_CALMI|eukprot:gi/632992342/ref/XP_007885046.1/ PREDICTED: NADH dehydrogenase [ubiquinone] 1 beta subcomplex subunit 11, mitochondrial [Callorhinchus milii]